MATKKRKLRKTRSVLHPQFRGTTGYKKKRLVNELYTNYFRTHSPGDEFYEAMKDEAAVIGITPSAVREEMRNPKKARRKK